MILSVPLAFAAFDIPTSAMNLTVVGPAAQMRLAEKSVQTPSGSGSAEFPIFTTPAVREQFLSDEHPVKFDVFKERYFRQHVPFGAIIYREAVKHDLPPELVAAMVHTESDFRPKLVSGKSAQGLMQIVPDTAELLGIRDPFDPEQNIAAGTKYFRYLLDRFENETVALAAYNAGEGNVARFGGVPPFAETQSYIAKVNRRTHRYRQRVHSNFLTVLRVRAAEQ